MTSLFSHFERLDLSKKFFLIFSLIGGTSAVVAAIVGYSVIRIVECNEQTDKAMIKVQRIDAVRFETSLIWQFLTDASLTQDAGVIAAEALPAKRRVEALLDSLMSEEDSTPEEQEHYTTVRKQLQELYATGINMVAAYGTGKRQGDAVMDKFDGSASVLLAEMKETVGMLENNLQSVVEARNQLLLQVIYMTAGSGFLLIVLTTLLSRWLTNYITTPIRKISNVAVHLAEGDFTYRVTDIREKDELGRASHEFNDMADQIEALMKEIITSIEFAGQGKYYRKPLPSGLRGMLNKAANQVSRSIQEQENRNNLMRDEKEYLVERTNEMLHAMERFAQGDLTVTVEKMREDEVGKLFDGFNAAVGNLNRRLTEVNDSVEKAASASATISSSATQMAAGAEEQSTQVGEVASAVEEISKAISENANNAQEAVTIANTSMEAAEKGGAIVQKTIHGMETISGVIRRSAETINTLGHSSSQIGEIISVINDIADQTNLLALNAAIEAARAGEQGRGFAVVADEVRKLAERTSKATKEISVMIRRIQEETQEAVKGIQTGADNVEKERVLAGEAGEALNDIVERVGRMVGVISSIATANSEQARASEDITRNINGISSVTDENAQAIDQIARSTNEVEQITGDLHSLVGKFKLGTTNGHRSAAAAETNGHSHAVMNGGSVLHAPVFNTEKAKTAHKLWRMRVMRLIDGSEHITENEVTTHRECTLGQWYYAQGKEMYGDDPVFRELGTVHETMHTQLKKIVTAWNNGQKEDAKQLTKLFYAMSDQVVTVLDRLKEHHEQHV